MYLELIVWGILATFILVFLSTAFLEKQHLDDFVSDSASDTAADSAYFSEMNSAAKRLGFASAGVFAQKRTSKLYQARVALWVSPDGRILLLVGGGKTARVRIRRSTLISVIEPDQIIQTQDDFGMADLSGLTSRRVVLNADLDELLAAHLERLSSSAGPYRRFSTGTGFADWHSINAMRSQQMARLGLLKFLNREETLWRHTLKGAWLQYYTGFRSQLAEGKSQTARIHKKRPGD